MRKKRLTGIFVWNSSITSLAGIQVVQGAEISSKIGDSRQKRVFDNHNIQFVFQEYDPASGLLPIYQFVSLWMGEEYDNAKLLFLNTSGEVAIPANENWRLISGFQKGQAFVKEINTGDLVRIDTAGTETGRFAVGEEIASVSVLPENSQYSFFYLTGKAGFETGEPENFKVVFMDENGGKKTLELQNTYWNMGDFEANGYAPLFQMKSTYETQWKIEGSEHWNTVVHYNTEQIDYVDINGVIHSGSMPGYTEKEKAEYIPTPYDIGLPFDRTTNIYTYKANSYDLKRVDTISFIGDIYEIFDKSGAGTGVNIYSIAFGTDNFIIARAYDSDYSKNYNFEEPAPEPPYYIYYINQTN